MTVPSHPSGYDTTKDVPASHRDCHLTVGFDRRGASIPRFLVRLHYITSLAPRQWTPIARFDHNETNAEGHDVYQEGLHIDISLLSGGEVTISPRQNPLPQNRGAVIRACVEYFDQEAEYFVDVYTGNISPSSAPKWPDGGEQPPTLLRAKRIAQHMRPESHDDTTVSKEELSDILAEATGTTAEEIEEGADDLELGPPDEADIVSVSEE